MSVRIRPYEAADLPVVLELITSILTEHGFSPEVVGLSRDAPLEAEYAREGAGFWVAVLGDRIAGTVAVRPKEPGTGELKRLYVRSDARGAGVGRALYAHAEAFARRAGYARIWLDSSRRFKEARRLYEKNGFVLVREVDNAWEDNEYEKVL